MAALLARVDAAIERTLAGVAAIEQPGPSFHDNLAIVGLVIS
jgi:hypothetical protein